MNIREEYEKFVGHHIFWGGRESENELKSLLSRAYQIGRKAGYNKALTDMQYGLYGVADKLTK